MNLLRILESLVVVRSPLGQLECHHQCTKHSAGRQELEVPHHARLLWRRRRVVVACLVGGEEKKKTMGEYRYTSWILHLPRLPLRCLFPQDFSPPPLYLVVILGLAKRSRGNRNDIMVVMDLACHRRESEIRHHRHRDIRQSKAIIPLIPCLGLEFELQDSQDSH